MQNSFIKIIDNKKQQQQADLRQQNYLCINPCGTRKLQFFYAEILPELKNRPMPKTVNAVCKKIIKVKNSFEISGIYFNS